MDRSSLSLRSVALGASLVAVMAGAPWRRPEPRGTGAGRPCPVPSFGPVAGLPAPTSLITPGTITDCVDIEYPPMEYFPTSDVTDENQAIGFDVDGARAVAAALGLQLAVKNTAFDSAHPGPRGWSLRHRLDRALHQRQAAQGRGCGPVSGHRAADHGPRGQPQGHRTPWMTCAGKTVAIQSGGVVESRLDAQSKACTDAGKAGHRQAGIPQGRRRVPADRARSRGCHLGDGHRRQGVDDDSTRIRTRSPTRCPRTSTASTTPRVPRISAHHSRQRSRRSTGTAPCPPWRPSTASTRPHSTPPAVAAPARAARRR